MDLLLAGCRTHRRGGRRGERGQQGRLSAACTSAVAGEGDCHRRGAPATRRRVRRSTAGAGEHCRARRLARRTLEHRRRTRRRRRGHRVTLLHVGNDRGFKGRRYYVALLVHHGCDGRVSLGLQTRRSAVDGDAVVSPQRRAGGAGADAGRRDHGIGAQLSSGLGVGRGARLRRRGFRRRRRDGLDARGISRRIRAMGSCRCASSPPRRSPPGCTATSKSVTDAESSPCTV